MPRRKESLSRDERTTGWFHELLNFLRAPLFSLMTKQPVRLQKNRMNASRAGEEEKPGERRDDPRRLVLFVQIYGEDGNAGGNR